MISRSDPQDLLIVAKLSSNACPRRYCWFWKGVKFRWDLSAEQGCDYPSTAAQSSTFPAGTCKRADNSSEMDCFEPRDPYLIADGIPIERFTV